MFVPNIIELCGARSRTHTDDKVVNGGVYEEVAVGAEDGNTVSGFEWLDFK